MRRLLRCLMSAALIPTGLAVLFPQAAALPQRFQKETVFRRAAGSPLRTDGGALRIGGNSIWGEYLEDLIDEVRAHDRTLTPAQLHTGMNTLL